MVKSPRGEMDFISSQEVRQRVPRLTSFSSGFSFLSGIFGLGHEFLNIKHELRSESLHGECR